MALKTLQNGRYRILRPLGSGSMGEVYLVEDTRINRQVAIKVIRSESNPYPGTSESLDASRLFEREAKSVARLNHPNILPLYDFGEEKVNGSLLTYMVMPYSPDGSLATWLQQHSYGGTLPPQEVAHFVREAANALQNAHDTGIIHQDVKPQNFLIRGSNTTHLPNLLLADFGIAKLSQGTAGASQVIRGTPLYMAPEQWEGNPVPASDQYSLAIMAYQLLTGKTPFQGGPGQMMYQHFNVSPLPPSAVNPSLSPDIDTVILRALAKRPEARFPTVAAFADAFEQAATAGGPTLIHPPGTPGSNLQPNVPFIPGYRPGAESGMGTDGDHLMLPGTANGRSMIGGMSTIYSPIDSSPRNTPVVPPAYQPPFGGPGTPNGPVRPDPNRNRSSRATAILILLIVLLLIIASVIGVIFFIVGNNTRANSTSATATAAAISNQNGTTTSQNNASATAQSNLNATSTAGSKLNATSTANSLSQHNQNATATAQTNSNATATTQTNNNATATAQAATATATASTTPFTVQSINLTVSPASINGIACGTNITVTYTATFTVPANTPGGTVQFTYTKKWRPKQSEREYHIRARRDDKNLHFHLDWRSAVRSY